MIKMMAMWRVLMLFLVLAVLGQKAHGTEIVNGKKVPDRLMLYMASVQNDRGQHICGGFLISEDFVVTAAHCDKNNPTSVVLGTHNLKKVDDGTMRYNVTRCKHPDFDSVKSGNDIMLLKLSKKVQLSNKVQPIQIPKGEMKLKDNAKCRVVGWGSTKDGGKISNVLEMGDVTLANLKQCKAKWKFLKQDLPNNVICAGGHKAKAGFCKGDSGGPLVCGATAAGVVSFSSRCDPDIPNVYTDVSKYVSWIKKIRKQKHC
ncbi:PREDICTED: granzyme B(G,H)-like [Poecilia mexicana]|uniref:Peptidase S1 domain-containing protein n=1 Tax=Poecilia mexicana TaxID=48701 RepID=A0A3B3YIU5_9TELE|nr:PREDICTED: granzyme B(G,H)-like [Poecilia mexicana]